MPYYNFRSTCEICHEAYSVANVFIGINSYHMCEDCSRAVERRSVENRDNIKLPTTYCVYEDGSIETVTPSLNRVCSRAANSYYEVNTPKNLFYKICDGNVECVTLANNSDFTVRNRFTVGERAFLSLEEAKEKSQDILKSKLDELAMEFSKVKRLFESRLNGDYDHHE